MLFPKSSVQMNDIWHTIGLRGTASNEYVVEDLFVPQHHAMRATPRRAARGRAAVSFHQQPAVFVRLRRRRPGHRARHDRAFLDLPATKMSRGAGRPMRENNVVQSQLAQCEARWRSARAFLHTTWETAWEHVEQTGEQTAEDRAMIRLASTWAIQQSREVVNTLYHAAGSMAVFEEQPFERRLRDIHTVAQQSQGRQLHYETVGQILLGMEPENQF